MKPTRLHFFYAYKWPVWIWIIVVPLLFVAVMAIDLGMLITAITVAGSTWYLVSRRNSPT